MEKALKIDLYTHLLTLTLSNQLYLRLKKMSDFNFATYCLFPNQIHAENPEKNLMMFSLFETPAVSSFEVKT